MPPPAYPLTLRPTPGVGEYVRFSEVAFFHKASRSLVVTDAVVYVPQDAPEIISVKVGGWVVEQEGQSSPCGGWDRHTHTHSHTHTHRERERERESVVCVCVCE